MLKAIVRRGGERLRVRSVPRVLRSVPRAQTLCADRTMGEGAKRSKVSEVLFGARRRATARSATRSAARRRATGQLSGIWLGLWVSASGGAAQSASIFIAILKIAISWGKNQAMVMMGPS